MINDAWLPNGYKVNKDTVFRTTLYSGDKVQILKADKNQVVIVAKPEIVRKWSELGLMDFSLFQEIRFGREYYYILSCNENYLLAPVELMHPPETKTEALSFAVSIRETRKTLPTGSLWDSIFIEKYSRLLPTWTEPCDVSDDVVLGRWITGGVNISVYEFKRLCSLIGWLSPKDISDIVIAADMEVPVEVSTGQAIEEYEDNNIRKMDKSKFELPGRPLLENFINEHIIDIIENQNKYLAFGISFPPAFILHGPPGCGKTYAVEQLVKYLNWPCYSIDSGSVGSPFIHDTSKKISETFDKAIETAPSVIIIDEMESFLSVRDSGINGSHHIEEVAEFLRRIPEAVNNRVLVIGMTNMLELIDPAAMRRGRFDHVIEVGMPTKEEIVPLLSNLLNTIPISDSVNTEDIADKLNGYPLSDIAFVVREATRLAAKNGAPELAIRNINDAISNLPGKREKKNRKIGFDISSNH